jgi:membrane fusion protein, multidrug efflux system
MKMHPFRRSLAPAAAAVLLMGAPPGLAQAPPSAPPPVTVARPIVKPIVERDDFVGRFDAVDYVEIRSRVSGYLENVVFRDGALVSRGELLFVIDKRPYKAALDQAEASVISAQARLNFAENDLERAESLRRTGNIAEQLLDQRRQNFLIAKAELDRANGAVREARLNYEFTEIQAPLSGRIGRKLVSEGNVVNANSTLLTTIVSLDPIYFYFDLDERSFLAYQRTLQMGSLSEASRNQLPVVVGLTDEKEFKRKGVLDFLDNRVDQATGTMRARASIENKDFFIRPGLFGTIEVPGSPQYQGILVPDEALGTDQDRRIVWVLADDNTVSPRVVRPGPRIDGYRVIREGLKGDETIVISGLQRIRPGAKVMPQHKELPPARS